MMIELMCLLIGLFVGFGVSVFLISLLMNLSKDNAGGYQPIDNVCSDNPLNGGSGLVYNHDVPKGPVPQPKKSKKKDESGVMYTVDPVCNECLSKIKGSAIVEHSKCSKCNTIILDVRDSFHGSEIPNNYRPS